MIRFLSISSFRKRFDALMKTKRGVYQNVHNEIIREFNGKTIQDIRNNNDMILIANDLIIIKLRLPDKKHKLSKKRWLQIDLSCIKEYRERCILRYLSEKWTISTIRYFR